MFVRMFFLMAKIKNTSLIIRGRHRTVQQESKYQRDETTQRLQMRVEVVFDNLICQYLASDIESKYCVEYLKTKVDVWFSAIRSIEELIFVESNRYKFKTTKEKLQKCKDDDVNTNIIAFKKAFSALLETNLFDRVKKIDETIKDSIEKSDALIIKYMKKPWKSEQRLDRCLAECVRLQCLFEMIRCFFEASKKGSFDDAPNIELKLSKIFLILKNAKKTFLSANTTKKHKSK